jgi:hypothetical protein
MTDVFQTPSSCEPRPCPCVSSSETIDLGIGRSVHLESTSVLLYGWRCVVRNSWRARQKRTQVVCGITNKFEWWRKEYGHVWLWTDGHLPVRCLYITHKGTCRSIDASGACIGSVLPAYSIFLGCRSVRMYERTMCHSLMRETAIRLSKWCGPSKLIRRYHSVPQLRPQTQDVF